MLDRDVHPTRWGAVVMAVLCAVVLETPKVLLLEGASFRVGGPAMEPTYRNEQLCVMDRSAYALSPIVLALPSLGEVVVAEAPDGVGILKRVVGLPGDIIELREGRLVRNGDPVPLERVDDCDATAIRDPGAGCTIFEERIGETSYRVAFDGYFDDDVPPATVPRDHVYLVGDRRDRSNDSRNPMIGPLHASALRGRVVACLPAGAKDAR